MSMGNAIKAKAAGTRKGIPDLFLPIPIAGYHGLYIELKRISGGKLSPHQKERMQMLSNYGYCCVRCNGGDAAKRAIKTYLSLLDNN